MLVALELACFVLCLLETKMSLSLQHLFTVAVRSHFGSSWWLKPFFDICHDLVDHATEDQKAPRLI